MAGLFGKNEEDKAQKAAEKAQQQQRERQQAELVKFNASPLGRARRAASAGDGWFQFTIDIEDIGRDWLATFSGTMDTRVKAVDDTVGGLLTLVEAEGWRLVNSGFVYRQTHQDSRDKFLSSGQQVAITGQTVGVYLFQRAGA